MHSKFKFDFWNFLEFFFPSIFNPWLVEFEDAEPAEVKPVDVEGPLYVDFYKAWCYKVYPNERGVIPWLMECSD